MPLHQTKEPGEGVSRLDLLLRLREAESLKGKALQRLEQGRNLARHLLAGDLSAGEFTRELRETLLELEAEAVCSLAEADEAIGDCLQELEAYDDSLVTLSNDYSRDLNLTRKRAVPFEPA